MFREDVSKYSLWVLKLFFYPPTWPQTTLISNLASHFCPFTQLTTQKKTTLKSTSCNWKKRSTPLVFFKWMTGLFNQTYGLEAVMTVCLTQVSLLFKPRERKGNWRWWRGQIAWRQLDEANTLFWSEGSKAWPSPCVDMWAKCIHVHMHTHSRHTQKISLSAEGLKVCHIKSEHRPSIWNQTLPSHR